MRSKDQGPALEITSDLEVKHQQLQQAGAGFRRGLTGVLLLIIGLLGGWNLRNNFQFQEEINAITVNRAINTHNVFAAETQEYTNRRSLDRLFRHWLKRVIQIPQDKDLSLKGGRILTVESNGVAGLLVYKGKKNDKPISLYIELSPKNIDVARPFCERVAPVTTCYWQRDELNFVTVADMDASDLRELSKKFILQLLPAEK